MEGHEMLSAMVEALKSELPGISFGYIGNCGVNRYGQFDDRSWRIFLPHPGRVGEWATDCVSIGSTGQMNATTHEQFLKLADRARKLYHNGSRRV